MGAGLETILDVWQGQSTLAGSASLWPELVCLTNTAHKHIDPATVCQGNIYAGSLLQSPAQQIYGQSFACPCLLMASPAQCSRHMHDGDVFNKPAHASAERGCYSLFVKVHLLEAATCVLPQSTTTRRARERYLTKTRSHLDTIGKTVMYGHPPRVVRDSPPHPYGTAPGVQQAGTPQQGMDAFPRMNLAFRKNNKDLKTNWRGWLARIQNILAGGNGGVPLSGRR